MGLPTLTEGTEQEAFVSFQHQYCSGPCVLCILRLIFRLPWGKPISYAMNVARKKLFYHQFWQAELGISATLAWLKATAVSSLCRSVRFQELPSPTWVWLSLSAALLFFFCGFFSSEQSHRFSCIGLCLVLLDVLKLKLCICSDKKIAESHFKIIPLVLGIECYFTN